MRSEEEEEEASAYDSSNDCQNPMKSHNICAGTDILQILIKNRISVQAWVFCIFLKENSQNICAGTDKTDISIANKQNICAGTDKIDILNIWKPLGLRCMI